MKARIPEDEARCRKLADKLRASFKVVAVHISPDPEIEDHDIELEHGVTVQVPVMGGPPIVVGKNPDGTFTFYAEQVSHPGLLAQLRLVLHERSRRMATKKESKEG